MVELTGASWSRGLLGSLVCLILNYFTKYTTVTFAASGEIIVEDFDGSIWKTGISNNPLLFRQNWLLQKEQLRFGKAYLRSPFQGSPRLASLLPISRRPTWCSRGGLVALIWYSCYTLANVRHVGLISGICGMCKISYNKSDWRNSPIPSGVSAAWIDTIMFSKEIWLAMVCLESGNVWAGHPNK